MNQKFFSKEFFYSAEGRLNRQPFWMFQLFVFGVVIVMAALSAALAKTLGALLFVPLGIVYIAIIVASIFVQIRRWHDRDKSGWWFFIAFVPVIGGIWALIETGFLPGTPGPNQFGPDPLGGVALPSATAPVVG